MQKTKITRQPKPPPKADPEADPRIKHLHRLLPAFHLTEDDWKHQVRGFAFGMIEEIRVGEIKSFEDLMHPGLIATWDKEIADAGIYFGIDWEKISESEDKEELDKAYREIESRSMLFYGTMMAILYSD